MYYKVVVLHGITNYFYQIEISILFLFNLNKNPMLSLLDSVSITPLNTKSLSHIKCFVMKIKSKKQSRITYNTALRNVPQFGKMTQLYWYYVCTVQRMGAEAIVCRAQTEGARGFMSLSRHMATT